METVQFTSTESINLSVPQEKTPIQHYLRQPQRLVSAIANPKLMTQLSENRFHLKMRPLNFLDMYHFQPSVVLKVVADSNGTVTLTSESCEILGNDYINDRFGMNLKGKLYPVEKNGQVYLEGKADLKVDVDLPPPLWLTPRPMLETTGNGLLKSVLMRIKQKLMNQLIADYRQWANQATTSEPTKPSLSSPKTA
ncbi:DUF1997 domain-containing protein [Euhalothece natronophila Z-M001]|uniref:DUF1997 domain-containing protein n=1 Tax=Euhalothece natronophila Z-M001 TaxID=522448 RepID=A0A5B8NQJ2_9CHRO|nr:DUF1997 domain-containing protein [Euhalothece natronophila]QDZ40519.1 DUF1997 domain-containing protein [Euhalothece natronophila Z-M001]